MNKLTKRRVTIIGGCIATIITGWLITLAAYHLEIHLNPDNTRPVFPAFALGIIGIASIIAPTFLAVVTVPDWFHERSGDDD